MVKSPLVPDDAENTNEVIKKKSYILLIIGSLGTPLLVVVDLSCLLVI
jgi:hypothetical protein